jgi:hypothetical protein
MFYLLMAHLDHRYPTIKPMLDQGRIKSFMDIFIYVPKTVIAADMGKNLSRFNALLDHIVDFTIKDLLIIASYCNLTRTEIFKLIDEEIALRNEEATDQ